jgi:hypothetical protein
MELILGLNPMTVFDAGASHAGGVKRRRMRHTAEKRVSRSMDDHCLADCGQLAVSISVKRTASTTTS